MNEIDIRRDEKSELEKDLESRLADSPQNNARTEAAFIKERQELFTKAMANGVESKLKTVDPHTGRGKMKLPVTAGVNRKQRRQEERRLMKLIKDVKKGRPVDPFAN